ncbi:MAG: hypothetical protein M3Y45_09330 [Actinomycetota bacterium]|nr:hypothetical protein [Actinomycetota bacterium]
MDIDELLAEDTVHPQFEPGQGWLAGMDRESDSWLDQVLLCRGDETDTALSGGFLGSQNPDGRQSPGN